MSEDKEHRISPPMVEISKPMYEEVKKVVAEPMYPDLPDDEQSRMIRKLVEDRLRALAARMLVSDAFALARGDGKSEIQKEINRTYGSPLHLALDMSSAEDLTIQQMSRLSRSTGKTTVTSCLIYTPTGRKK